MDNTHSVLCLIGGEDEENLLSTLSQNYNLIFTRTAEEAISMLQSPGSRVAVVLCDRRLPPAWDKEDWKGFLSLLRQLPSHIPLLIVAETGADDRFWAEVIDEGGYDILVKPFESAEVLRVIGQAYLKFASTLSTAIRH